MIKKLLFIILSMACAALSAAHANPTLDAIRDGLIFTVLEADGTPEPAAHQFSLYCRPEFLTYVPPGSEEKSAPCTLEVISISTCDELEGQALFFTKAYRYTDGAEHKDKRLTIEFLANGEVRFDVKNISSSWVGPNKLNATLRFDPSYDRSKDLYPMLESFSGVISWEKWGPVKKTPAPVQLILQKGPYVKVSRSCPMGAMSS